jgi:hypothetical protein
MGFEKRDSKQYFKTTTIQYILFPVKNVNKKYRENAKGHIYKKLDCVPKTCLYYI